MTNKIYKSPETLPLYNWVKIHESEPFDLRYLYKFDKDEEPPAIEDFEKLFKIYQNIIYKLKDFDTKLMSLFVNFEIENVKLRSIYLSNQLNRLLNEPEIKPKFDKANKLLFAYLNELAESNEDFEISIYSFSNEYTKIWKQNFKSEVPKFLHKFKGIGFHIFEQYEMFLKDFTIVEKMTAKQVSFIDMFFTHEILKVPNLNALNKLLEPVFAENNNIENWLRIRAILFNSQNLKYKSKSKDEGDYLKTLIEFQQILEINIDMKDITLAEFQAYRSKSFETIEKLKQKNHGTI